MSWVKFELLSSPDLNRFIEKWGSEVRRQSDSQGGEEYAPAHPACVTCSRPGGPATLPSVALRLRVLFAVLPPGPPPCQSPASNFCDYATSPHRAISDGS